jgi:hypothetical protein
VTQSPTLVRDAVVATGPVKVYGGGEIPALALAA